MAIAEFELGLEFDSAGESIPEIYIFSFGLYEAAAPLRVAPHGQGMPHPIGAVKAGAMNLIRQRVHFFLGVAWAWIWQVH